MASKLENTDSRKPWLSECDSIQTRALFVKEPEKLSKLIQDLISLHNNRFHSISKEDREYFYFAARASLHAIHRVSKEHPYEQTISPLRSYMSAFNHDRYCFSSAR